MPRTLTPKQRQLLQLLQQSLAASGRLPSLRLLGEQLGGITPAAVHLQLGALARKGYLRWPRGRPKELTLTPLVRTGPVEAVPGLGALRVPVVGAIAAGQPIDAFESADGTVLVEQEYLPRGGQEAGLYALRVRGDSMVDACIQDGDVVIVRSQSTAQDGDTVVALLEGQQATLKRFFRDPERDQIKLLPANPYYPPIFAKEVQIQGKVVGIVRYCA